VTVPLHRQVAWLNRHVTNRILGPIVWFLPKFGRIEHVGRRTGQLHDAPIMAFRSHDRRTLTFALTYGTDADWVKNGLAAGELGFNSRWTGPLRLVQPRLVHDPQRRAMPWLVRRVLGLIGVDDFLRTTIDPDPGVPTGSAPLDRTA
jgi:deazaflavin-dependent oxidoreductase (nitroreductase family)